MFLFFVCTLSSSLSYAQEVKDNTESEYLVGTGIEDFTRLLNGSLPHNLGTYGYAKYRRPIDTTINRPAGHIENGVHLPLKTRVISITHQPSQRNFIYVLLDLAFASDNIRRSVLKKIHQVDPTFESASLMITATHTHSAPAGFSDYLGYELVTPGYRPEYVETIATRTYEAILAAWDNQQPMDLIFSESTVPDDVPIAFSRKALPAYNNNPEVREPIDAEHNYKATDRIWQMIHFEHEDELHSMLNFFGAHPNRLGAEIISSDTRGAASQYAELELPKNGIALFAQNAPGDIDDEGHYRGKVSKDNEFIWHPAYTWRDSLGNPHQIRRTDRVMKEGEILKDQAFNTAASPTETFNVTGGIDCELIYVDMGNQSIPKGKYAKTLDPVDYYTNDFYLWGNWGKFVSVFKPKLSVAQTSPPTIGLGAIARIGENLETFVIGLERMLRYSRLSLTMFKDFDKAKYVWQMYRSQGQKTVMLEGGQHCSAVGFKLGGALFDIFARFDDILLELERDHQMGLHDEHTMYPSIIPIQIVIIGNVAIAGISGEPGNIAGQRIENAILAHLQKRGVKKVIGNGYANENAGYIFTPEEYPSQFAPQQCGFVLYGRWTEPAFRYNFEKLAKAMLVDGEEREALLDRSIQHPVFSDEWYEKTSALRHIPKVVKEKKKKKRK